MQKCRKFKIVKIFYTKWILPHSAQTWILNPSWALMRARVGYKICFEPTHAPSSCIFFTSINKTSFIKCFSFVPRGAKLIFKTGNGIVQTWNGIISPTSRPPIKKLPFLNVFICSNGFKIDFQNRKWAFLNRKGDFQNRKSICPNRKWNYFSHFQVSDQKTSFTKCFSFVPRISKLIFIIHNRKWNYPNRKWNYFPTFRPLIKIKLLL